MASYESTTKPSLLSESQIDRITKIAYFGYGYKNHTEPKWYAITQFMIWKESAYGYYYFTNYLNGNKIDRFQDEMNEINNLIDNYNKLPSFDNEYTIISGNELVLEKDISNLKVTGDNLRIENNKLIINPTTEGEHIYKLEKEDNIHNKPYIFYESSTSQDLLQTGNIPNVSTSFKVNVIKTEIELTKLDKDTKSILPKGEASLDGAIYSLYDENNNLIKDLVIENNQAIINNIPFGKYYLKEKEAGTGYLLDTNTYEVNITKEKSKHQVIVENKVIDKNITIEKKYGENDNFTGEENIEFQIINSNYEEISSITTNNQGIAEITLPYGTYTLKQINTTEGYYKADDITINVDNTTNELIEIKDLKIEVPVEKKEIIIEVPNTSTNNYLLLLIIKYLLILW